jgi:hypothetical protein
MENEKDINDMTEEEIIAIYGAPPKDEDIPIAPVTHGIEEKYETGDKNI